MTSFNDLSAISYIDGSGSAYDHNGHATPFFLDRGAIKMAWREAPVAHIDERSGSISTSFGHRTGLWAEPTTGDPRSMRVTWKG